MPVFALLDVSSPNGLEGESFSLSGCFPVMRKLG